MTFEELMALPEAERAEAYKKYLNEKNSENKSLRDRLKKTSPKAMEVYEALKLKFGVDEVDEAFLDLIQQQSTTAMSTEQQLNQLKKMLEKEQGTNKQLSEKLSATERAQRERDRDATIVTALSSIKVRGEAMDDARKLIASESSYDEATGTWMFSGKNLAEYIQDFAKAKPYLLGNPVKPGSSDSKASNDGKLDDPEFISEEDYLKLSPEQQMDKVIRARVHKSMDLWRK